jgi:hypothetical protein
MYHARMLIRATCLTLTTAFVLRCAGGNVASQLARPPEFKPTDETQCAIVASRSKPLVVEWPSADRGELEARIRHDGLVVVSYSGCQMRVLDQCIAGSSYVYAPITRKKDHLGIHNTDDLYANVPVGAAKLEAKLATAGQLDVDMTLVGRWEGLAPTVREDGLTGRCDGATHVMSALTVGAFKFTAGADAEVGGGVKAFGAGGGAKSTSARETLSKDGSENACEKSTMVDRAPPEECGAPIRVEVVPLVPRNPLAGRWSCSGATVTLTDAAGHTATTPPTAQVGYRTIADNGDGTVRVENAAPFPACPHRLVVSGSSATLAEPYTCQLSDHVSATNRSVEVTVTDGVSTSRSTGTWVIDKVPYSVVDTATCKRLGP